MKLLIFFLLLSKLFDNDTIEYDIDLSDLNSGLNTEKLGRGLYTVICFDYCSNNLK